jgi:hypothetical protein
MGKMDEGIKNKRVKNIPGGVCGMVVFLGAHPEQLHPEHQLEVHRLNLHLLV